MVFRAKILSSTTLEADNSMKISIAQINPINGDLFGNTEKILAALEKGKA